MTAGRTVLSSGLRLLRSRRLVVVLLVLFTVFSLVGTLVPQGRAGDARVAEWASAHPVAERLAALLDLHGVYGSPLFLALVAVLSLSTAICAWERTSAARKLLRSAEGASGAATRRLEERPGAIVPVTNGSEDAAPAVEGALSRLHLRVSREGGLIAARGGRLGLVGSPLFHWSLVALVAVIGAGQLARSEGLMGVPVAAGPVPDVAASYGLLDRGPLYSDAADPLRVRVDRIYFSYMVGGIDRGAVPQVDVLRGGRVLASQLVYANNPLRLGDLLVHQSDYGLSPAVEVIAPDGSVVASEAGIADFDETAPTGVTAIELDATGVGSRPVVITLEVVADRRGDEILREIPREPRALVFVRQASGETSSATIPLGGSVPLAGGGRLRFAKLGYYARLSVVHDWSIYPMYVLFAITALGLALAIFDPWRSVWVLLEDPGGGGREARIVVTHSRRDPSLLVRAEQAVRGAVGAPAPDTEE